MPNPIDVSATRALEEKLKQQSEARALLNAGRPLWASLLQVLGSIAAMIAVNDSSGLPFPAQLALAACAAFVPAACIELALLRRELNAAIVLLRATDERV